MPHDPSSDAAGRSREERLRLARRMDARFLLADPEVGRVVLAGSPDPALAEAAKAAGADGARAETVILSGRWDRPALLEAVAAAGPTGRLIIERDVRHPLARSRPPATERIARSLVAGGWHSVATWLTWPTRDRAAVWVRVDDPV